MTETESHVSIASLMEHSGVKFGTSGARGLAADMTDRVCYAYTVAFLQHLERPGESRGGEVAIAGDYRPSSGRIMEACARAVKDLGCRPVNCGRVATPTLANFGLQRGIPGLVVTGSHIPDDRNGIKFYTGDGEILKRDEQGIRAQDVALDPDMFTATGALTGGDPALPPEDRSAYDAYVRRYLDFFAPGCLAGRNIGLYEHSSVAREACYDVLTGLGANVLRLGHSERFIPVDTEAIRPEDVVLARDWAKAHAFDCLVSTDGDGDRPLVSDEQGRWLRGDIAGILCARFLGADTVVTPVSSNTAVEKSGWFKQVIRTRIGSPYVIEAMQQALANGAKQVVGYEANGGFLIASDIRRSGRTLAVLPTRDAVIVALGILMLAADSGTSISALQASLPPRFTTSDRLKDFPTDLSRERIASFSSGDFTADKERIEAVFGASLGKVDCLDTTDGLRITFESGEIAHLRPSGNAPELRCYNEADTEERAEELNRICMQILSGWR